MITIQLTLNEDDLKSLDMVINCKSSIDKNLIALAEHILQQVKEKESNS
jgi:hypothetical protein